MAWRIGAHVARGEIDNRQPGIVRGILYLEGQTHPVTLELEGDCDPDLAGRRLIFKHLMPRAMASPAGFSPLQCGEVGSMTANRMARIPTISEEEVSRCIREKVAIPTRWSESLYLEWFSDNGRVLLEGPSFICELSAPKWRLSEERYQWAQHLRQFACPPFDEDEPADGEPEDPDQSLVLREDEPNPFGWRVQSPDRGQHHPTLQRLSQFVLKTVFEYRAWKLYEDEAIENQPLEGMMDAVSQGTVRLARALSKAGTTPNPRSAKAVVAGLKQARWSLAVASQNASLAQHMGSAAVDWLKTLRRELADQRNEIRDLIHDYEELAQPSTPTASPDPNVGESSQK